jgi:ribosomal protein L11 methyltransferase
VTDGWLQLTVLTRPRNLDAIANFLMERGAPGVVVKARGLEAYFPSTRDDATLKQDVRRYLGGIARLSPNGTRPRAEWRAVRTENWQNSWKRFIKARRVGKCFWVTPPWISPPRFRRRQMITIEPGMAFGSGTHVTTRGCLEFIERVAESFQKQPFGALDVGTGSGILTIGLVKLGAERVWAIDNDPVALQVARENLRLNQVAEKVHLSGRPLSEIRKEFPVVVANLTAETITALAGGLERKVGAGGFLILSGILQQKAGAIARRLAPAFRVLARRRSREWATLLLQRK